MVGVAKEKDAAQLPPPELQPELLGPATPEALQGSEESSSMGAGC